MKVTIPKAPQVISTIGGNHNQPAIGVGIQGPPGPAGIQNISQAADVNVDTLVNGSLLIYNASMQKWVSNTTLENQSIEGGHY